MVSNPSRSPHATESQTPTTAEAAVARGFPLSRDRSEDVLTADEKITDASTRSPTPRFQAWRRRRGGRWQIVAQDDDEAACFRKLLDIAQRDVTGSFDQVILPAGQEP